jgi:hypothetical protein
MFKHGGVVSKTTRLKNAINIITKNKNALSRASNTKLVNILNKTGAPTGQKKIKKKGQKAKLIALLSFFQNKNNRIIGLINQLQATQQRKQFNDNKNVSDFIDMLELIKKANIPLFTPQNKKTETPSGKSIFNTLISKNVLTKNNLTRLSEQNRKLLNNYMGSITNAELINQSKRAKFYILQRALYNNEHFNRKPETPVTTPRIENTIYTPGTQRRRNTMYEGLNAQAKNMRKELEELQKHKVQTPRQKMPPKGPVRRLPPLPNPPKLPSPPKTATRQSPNNNNKKWANLLGPTHAR